MGEKGSILIVDDNESDCRSLSLIFENKGYKSETAGTGHEAIEKAKGKSFNVALVDIRLPDMEGTELFAPLREMHPDITVIMITAYASLESAVRALNQGASGYIIKPLNMDEVLAVITKALEEQRLVMENRRLYQEAQRELAERKKAEESLRESEEKYRSILESIEEGYYEVDIAGSFTFVNDSACKILGYSKEELMDMNKRQFMDPENAKKARQTFNKVYKTGEPSIGVDWEIVTKDGKKKGVEASVSLIKDAEGQPIGFRGIGRDITEQMQAEEENKRLEGRLQHAQRIESLGTLAGGIAHDFNNILAVILGYTELAMGELPRESLIHSNLNKVLKVGVRAKGLVQQILTFTRGPGQERGPVQMDLIVKEGLKLLRSSLPSTIEIRSDIATSGMVLGDATQIHQVMMNLCTNASHAMHEQGGVLEVRLRNVEFGVQSSELDLNAGMSSSRQAQCGDVLKPTDAMLSSELREDDIHSAFGLGPGSYVRLTVSDTGCGMDKEVMDRIFDPYFTTKERGRGTGLGLAVVHGIVTKCGGAIIVESELGKGSTFHVYLPAVKMQVVDKTQAIEPLPTGNERVLFIDDERAVASIGKEMLERLGYEVISRTSSVEALELFRTKPDIFDLVITDMTMPNMTGDKLAKKLMEIRPDIPIILCTGYSERISEEEAKAMGIRQFAMKPLAMKDLATTIRNVLDGRI